MPPKKPAAPKPLSFDRFVSAAENGDLALLDRALDVGVTRRGMKELLESALGAPHRHRLLDICSQRLKAGEATRTRVAAVGVLLAGAAKQTGAVERLLDREPRAPAAEGTWLYPEIVFSHRQAPDARLLETVNAFLDRGVRPDDFVRVTGGELLYADKNPALPALLALLVERGLSRDYLDPNLDVATQRVAGGGGEPWRDLVRLLVARGADPNVGLLAAATRRSPEAVDLLLELGAGIDANDGAALVAAIRRQDETEFLDLLLARGANVDAGDGAPLREAHRVGHLKAACWLIDRGAKTDGLKLETPQARLDLALKLGDLGLLRTALAEGADIHQRGASGWPPLLEAAIAGRARVVEYLASMGADPRLLGDAPLRQAAKAGHAEVVRSLVDLGADPRCLNDKPLRDAIRDGRSEIVALLLECGAPAEVAAAELMKMRAEEKEPDAEIARLVAAARNAG